MKKTIALLGFLAATTPASAMSLVSLHGSPVTLTSATTSFALVALFTLALLAVLGYRIAKN